MRGLVITADDLGRDTASTGVVLDLAAAGHVTATTLIPAAPGSADAARRAREAGLVPHLHVTLNGERGLPPWHPLSGGASLAGPDGALPDDPHVVGARAETADVEAELDAQLAWVRDQGLRPVVADSHAGTLYGLHGRSFLAEGIAWCARHGLAFRLPRDPAPYLGGPPPAPLAEVHARAVALADALGVALPATVWTNRRTAADLGSYESLRADLVARLDDLPEGVSELFLHPSTPDAPGVADVVRAWEARLLRDPTWHAALDRSGVVLTSGWSS
ncbi:hypothetical protein GCM10009809_10780 [Isoptericola hypogeus]|uniref:ChbG/HpnK family deacetylase n=1 Tax=Isoptericola hypogeus TaxID=300179 RepID=A0ABP4V2C0_9MICO